MANRVFQGFGVIDFGRSVNLRFDLGSRRADRVNALHALPQEIVEHGVVAALILATENQVQMNGGREGFERLNGGVDIRGLGVVLIIHVGNFGHEFEPVLDRFEIPHGLADLLGLASGEHTDSNAGEHVFQIVRSSQRNLRDRHDFSLAVSVSEIKIRATDKRSLFDFFFPAEPE